MQSARTGGVGYGIDRRRERRKLTSDQTDTGTTRKTSGFLVINGCPRLTAFAARKPDTKINYYLVRAELVSLRSPVPVHYRMALGRPSFLGRLLGSFVRTDVGV